MKVVTFLTVVLLGFSSIATPVAVAIKPKTMPIIIFKNNKKPHIAVCKAIHEECESGTVMWKTKKLDNTFYLVNSQLQMIKVTRNGDSFIKKESGIFIVNTMTQITQAMN